MGNISRQVVVGALSDVSNLAGYRDGVEHIRQAWPGFLEKRAERLQQQTRHGNAAEKVTENIIEDLLTSVLDWSLGDLNNQVHYADLVVTSLGIPRLIVETKRPGALAWNRRAVDVALEQVRRYADEQLVRHVAVSDGTMFYAADVEHGGLRDRVFCHLGAAEPELELWWLSIHGIYRTRPDTGVQLRLLPEDTETPAAIPISTTGDLLHPKYHVPARCFAYVGDASNTNTWALPFRCFDGSVDTKRLPAAINSIIRNYRGVNVRKIPEEDIPAVLKRLAEAAESLGYMPPAAANPATAYRELAKVLVQLGIRQSVGAQD